MRRRKKGGKGGNGEKGGDQLSLELVREEKAQSNVYIDG